MTDEPTGTAHERCPWCSSDRGTDAAGRCLSCGAALIADEGVAAVPGVTDVDTLGIIKQRTAKQPNRIVAWVTGDNPDPDTWTPAGEALDLPSLDVQREMLRLEFDAAIAAQQAEIDALRAEEALQAAEKAGQAPLAEATALAAPADEESPGADEESPDADEESPGAKDEPLEEGNGVDGPEETAEA